MSRNPFGGSPAYTLLGQIEQGVGDIVVDPGSVLAPDPGESLVIDGRLVWGPARTHYDGRASERLFALIRHDATNGLTFGIAVEEETEPDVFVPTGVVVERSPYTE